MHYYSFFQKSHLFLAFCSLCLTNFTQGQLQFSDLIGSETVRAEQVKVTTLTKNNANDNASVKLKTKAEEENVAEKRPLSLTPGFTSTRRGLTLLDLFASEQPRALLDEPETSPSR